MPIYVEEIKFIEMCFMITFCEIYLLMFLKQAWGFDAWYKDPLHLTMFSATCLATNFVPTFGPEEVSVERYEDHGKAGCISHGWSSSFWTTNNNVLMGKCDCSKKA